MARAQVVNLDDCSTSDTERGSVAAVPLLGHEESVQIAAVFELLSDPSRVRALFALLEAGEACVCDLAEMAQVSQSALSHALRLLRIAGVVTNRRDGRMVRYRLADSHVRLLLDVTREHLGHAPGAGRA